MSLTSSLSSALSGLTVASKAAQVVSSNVANATTEGYAPRVLNTSAVSTGGIGAGVRVDGVQRQVDQAVIADRREAGAQRAYDGVLADFQARIEATVGLPGEAGSLDAALVRFEAALVDAASRPEQTVRLDAAVAAAVHLTQTFNEASASVQRERQNADREIARQVEDLNRALQSIADLNKEISKRMATGRDALSLRDQRQVQIDLVSRIVPVSVLPRHHGQVALISTGGGVLLDGKPATIGFGRTHSIAPDMTVMSGALERPTLNGQAVDLSQRTNMLQGGSLDALFLVRDRQAPDTQASLDGLAAELVSRFEDPSVDASLGIGMPGVFSDAGAVFAPLDETGLSQRISVTARLDPALGGQTWRIRDGIGLSAPGPVGDASQLLSFVSALSETRTPVSPGAGAEPRTAFTLLSDIVSEIGRARQLAEKDLAVSSATWELWRSVELENGVDTDAEMQKLLLIEQAYSANAKVLETLEAMLDALTRI